MILNDEIILIYINLGSDTCVVFLWIVSIVIILFNILNKIDRGTASKKHPISFLT